MMMNTTIRSAAVLVSVCAGAASAGIPVFTDEAAFLASLSDPVITESYESYSYNVPTGPWDFELEHFDVSYSGVSLSGTSDEFSEELGLGPIDGDTFFRANFGGGVAAELVFSFETPVAAFGTYLKDLEAANLSVEVLLTNGQSFLSSVEMAGNGRAQYFGLEPIVEDIVSVTFRMGVVEGFDGVFFDRTSFAVPAPGAGAVLGLACLAARRRRG